MPRSNRPRPRRRSGPGNIRGAQKSQEPGEINLEWARAGLPQRETARDGQWAIRRISASNASKEYRCPGCHTIIRPGTAHIVVWQEDSLLGVQTALEDRRHWHDRCWSTRSFR